jgi:glycosyltransferase involved in cell wall biosynthesis
MNDQNLELTIIIPAYNEESVIGEVIKELHSVLKTNFKDKYEILVVDDGSDDNTGVVAAEAGARVITHPINIGNGAAIKSGIRASKGNILIMMDGDGQHPPNLVPSLIENIGLYDMVVGARTKESDSDIHRNWANKIYNWLASYVSGRKIEDLTCGFRAIKSDLARSFIYLLPNTFSYDITITLAALRSGRSLLYVPFKAERRIGKSKIKLIRDGLRFLLIILKISTYYSPLKVYIPLSILMFLSGFGYGLFQVVFLNTRYGPTSAMVMTVSVVIFVVGLVSEQIAQLQFRWSERFNNAKILDE